AAPRGATRRRLRVVALAGPIRRAGGPAATDVAGVDPRRRGAGDAGVRGGAQPAVRPVHRAGTARLKFAPKRLSNPPDRPARGGSIALSTPDAYDKASKGKAWLRSRSEEHTSELQ